jgi:hypothetical protein
VARLERPGLAACGLIRAAYESAGRLDEAIPLYERTLADFERVLGADHPGTLTVRRTLAALPHETE